MNLPNGGFIFICSLLFIMANPIQRLPVIEWQHESIPVIRTPAVSIPKNDTNFGFIVSVITVGAVLISGLLIAGISSINTDPTPQTYSYRSN
jgi:hypothetical protein